MTFGPQTPSLELPGVRGRVAIVWGGGAGMGEATARRLAASGARVAVVDRDADAAARVAQALDALAVTADVTEEADIMRAVAQVRDRFGCPTLSASVVGMASWRPLIEVSADEWDRDQRLNLRPMFLIGREVARAMLAEGHSGALAFVSSVSGLEGAALHAGYGAAKAAMNALARTMATEWGPHGIRVNVLAPGPIATARIRASREMDALLARRIPLGRMGRIEEMADVLLFLLSDMASFVTGEVLTADGGWMASPHIHPAEAPAAPIASNDRA